MSVCKDQDTFNNSFQESVKEMVKKERPNKTARTIAVFIWLLLLVWAVLLACSVPCMPHQKTEQILFAVMFPPLYILAYHMGSQN